MPYELRHEVVAAQPLAAIRATTTRAELTPTIFRQLDQVWPLLRAQGVTFGHNVVVYEGDVAGVMTIVAGVQVFGDFAEEGKVRRHATPAGETVATAHFGDYSELGGAYAALESWWRDNDRRPAGLSWEVYGDWDDDPAKVRTDVYFLLA